MGGGRSARVAGDGRARGDSGDEGPAYREAGGLLPRSAYEACGARTPDWRGHHTGLAGAGSTGEEDEEKETARLERFGGWLHDETGGQPFFLSETLSDLVERGVLVRHREAG